MTEIEKVKTILVQQYMNNKASTFTFVCYFPPHPQNNKKEPVKLRNSF